MESFNKFPEIAKAFDVAVQQVIKKTSFDLQANMQKQIRANGQIDTGFLVNSVYVRTFDESTYGQGTGQKASKSKGVHKASVKRIKAALAAQSQVESMLPEVEQPENNKTAYVGVAAPYGFWQNYGTHRLPARPFLEPGVERTRPGFEKALSKIEDKIKEQVH